MEMLGRMKLDLEAVMEDASKEVYSFQIQRSLKYLKFVGVVQGTYIIIQSVHRLFIRILLEEGLFSEILSCSTVFGYQQ